MFFLLLETTLSGTYCHRTGIDLLAVQTPRQPTIHTSLILVGLGGGMLKHFIHDFQNPMKFHYQNTFIDAFIMVVDDCDDSAFSRSWFGHRSIPNQLGSRRVRQRGAGVFFHFLKFLILVLFHRNAVHFCEKAILVKVV